MSKFNYNPLFLALYSIVKNYDSFIDVIWQYCKHPEAEEYYEFYENEFFGKENNKLSRENKIQIINSCLHLIDNIIPKFDCKQSLNVIFFEAKKKIKNYKLRWQDQVETFLATDNDKKYILKELTDIEDPIKKRNFIEMKKKIISEWALDERTLLSDFYYLDELKLNQINIICNDEAVYITLQDIYENDNVNLLELLKSSLSSMKKAAKSKSGAKVPNSMFEYDSLFLASSRKIDDLNYEEDESDNILITPNPENKNFQIIIPKFEVDENLNISFDYQQQNLVNSPYEFKTLVALFELGGDDLINGYNEIKFTLKDMCKRLDIEPCSENYNKLKFSIYNLKFKTYKTRISEKYERLFSIVDKIEKPVLNSDRELEWRVKIHEDLVQEIVNAKYKNVVTKKIAAFRFGVSILLLRIFIYDFEKKPVEKIRYLFSDLYARLGLNDKPYRNRKRVIDALDELCNTNDGIIIERYEIMPDPSYFMVYKNSNNILQSSVL